jgi:hypothetical protein
MSDPIAEAAAQMSDAAPSSTEPVMTQAVAEQPVPTVTGNVLVNAASVVDAPVLEAGTAATGEPSNTGADSAAPVDSSPTPTVDAAAELPRESHLMLLEAKFANALAKLRNAERVSVDELEAIYVHIKAVI